MDISGTVDCKMERVFGLFVDGDDNVVTEFDPLLRHPAVRPIRTIAVVEVHRLTTMIDDETKKEVRDKPFTQQVFTTNRFCIGDDAERGAG